MMKTFYRTVTVCLFLSFLFGFALAFLILPDNPFSAQENRSLRTLPQFTLKSFLSGAFSKQINEYFADQFPLRDALVGIKGSVEILLGKGENNGILLGDDGQLAQRLFDARMPDGHTANDTDCFSIDMIYNAASGAERAAQNLKIPFSILFTGRSIDVAASAFSYPKNINEQLLQTVEEAFCNRVPMIHTVRSLREKYDAGEYVYYKTDHHWTTLGAYYAYVETMKSFGMENAVLPMDAFDRQVVSTDFYGTAWSAGGMKFVPPDSMELWLLGNEDDFAINADGKTLEGFYNFSYLEKKDQYSLFLDGTHDVVTVNKKDGKPRQTLLLLKDSFANPMVPFLAQHFDLVILNLSSVKTDHTDLSAAAEQYAADRVLLVYTLENVITADKLAKLR